MGKDDTIRDEKLVKEDLRAWWNTIKGLKMWFYPQPGNAGVSDYIGIISNEWHHGIWISVEVKKTLREGLKLIEPSIIQRKHLKDVSALGGLSFCVHSKDECKRLFKQERIIE